MGIFSKQPHMYMGLGVFSAYGEPYTQKKTLISMWVETHSYGWPKKLIGPWKLKKFTWNGKGRTWEVTWIKRGRISLDNAPRIHVGSFELKWVKISNGMEFLNFLLFIEKFWNFLPTFYSFLPFLTILDRFELIWWCRSLFWVRVDRGFDPFGPISGIMSKLAYRLGFTSVCTLHDLMTVSL